MAQLEEPGLRTSSLAEPRLARRLVLGTAAAVRAECFATGQLRDLAIVLRLDR